MTSAWFDRFAENALDAADFIGRSNPAMARRFADAAASARGFAGELAHRERIAQLKAELTEAILQLAGKPEHLA